jgi:protein TonB
MQAITHPGTVAPARERSLITVALVGALHIAAIYTILVALDIVPSPLPNTAVNIHIVQVFQPAPPKPQPPAGRVVLARPDGPIAQKPDFNIGSDKGPGGIANPPTGDTFAPVSPIASTHSIPDYPVLDRRLNHEGIVRLALAIDAQGNVTGATVEHSSGYDGLDAAAIAWVKAHWRYKPALQNGTAVPATTQASVVFRLTQAAY